jgi:hypothetical protein
MTWGMTAVAAATVASGYMGSKAAKAAGGQIADATAYAADIEKEMFDLAREDLAPYRETGYTALKDIERLMPMFTQQFGPEQLARYLDPSMDFRMKYGTKATERLGNVGGGAISGNTLRALTEFGQDLASTEYANAFNRAQTEPTNIFNRLSNIAGLGQNAVNTGVQAGQATSANLGNLAVGGAQAQASGSVGATNAITGALQGLGNQYYLSQLMGPRGAVVPPPGYGTTGAPGMGGGTGVTVPAGFQFAPG